MPIWDGENREINKNLNIINFWTDELEALDKGKQSEPLHLVGIETGKATDTYSIVTKFQNVWDMINNHEEVTIAGLGTCMNGVYIIKNFSFETVPGSRVAFKWTLILEFVRTL